MIKTLSKQIKEYKGASIGTPLCMLLEVAMEMIIPLLMASIIDKGVNAGDMGHIYKIGAYMLCAAAVGLVAGLLGARLGSKASAGFAKNLRAAMYDNIQTFSFANIDKFSTAGLVTRLTTDVSNLQNAYQMILRMCVRAPTSMDGVDFGYNEDKMVLHDIKLYAEPGQKIAFVGSTGAGKTTITNLINRFYDIKDGKIRYDGININKIKKRDLRRSLGM